VFEDVTNPVCGRYWDVETRPKGGDMHREAQAWHGGRVLVCEDNFLMAEVVCDFLRECALEPIGPAAGLESAINLARECALDGALLDINLNGRLCFPVCTILSTRHVPFVFLTGYSELSRSLIPLEFRGARLLSKPFEPYDMKDALAEMLRVADGPSSGQVGPVLRH
jgi:DNA-binding response OmpR family regulator